MSSRLMTGQQHLDIHAITKLLQNLEDVGRGRGHGLTASRKALNDLGAGDKSAFTDMCALTNLLIRNNEIIAVSPLHAKETNWFAVEKDVAVRGDSTAAASKTEVSVEKASDADAETEGEESTKEKEEIEVPCEGEMISGESL